MAPGPPAEGSDVGEPSSSLGAAWYLAPPSWEVHQKGSQWHVYIFPLLSSGIRELGPVFDVDIRCMEDPVRGASFCFWPQDQSTVAS